MPRGSSPKRERRYEHILGAERERGIPEARAEEIAARTVNEARAHRHGPGRSRMTKAQLERALR